jgi:FMN phosphatase YigB (HAD superfamily)
MGYVSESPATSAPSKPAIVIDFDRVLFDTDAYVAGIRQSVGQVGVTRSHWDAAYQDRGDDQVLRIDRLLTNLAERSGKPRAQIQEAFERETGEAMWYLYADAREFLEAFKPVADVYLLSFGCKEWQGRKIEAVGIKDFFKSATIVEVPKADAKDVPVPSVSQAIFINDNQSEMLDMARRYRWARHLHINRAGDDLPPGFPFPSYPDLRTAAPAIAGSIGLTVSE